MNLYMACTDNGNDMISAGNAARAEQFTPPRMLLSYWYFKDRHLDDCVTDWAQYPLGQVDLFADSGAFSAYNAKSKVDVHAYADWLHRWKHRLTVYANLDVKGDVDAGLRNQRILEDKGLHPIPVFHGGEPFSVLADFSRDYDYLALGGIAGGHVRNDSPAALAWLVQAFKITGDTKVHGFGLTNYRILRRFPWHSADSSSWLAGIRFGGFTLWDHRIIKMVNIRQGRGAVLKHSDLLRSYGIVPRQIQRREYPSIKIAQFGGQAFIRYERWLNRKPVGTGKDISEK